MTDKKTGGPAFPVTLQPGEMYKHHAEFDGMTLRDYFAAKAMQGIIAGNGLGFSGMHPSYWDSLDGLAKTSYQMADAMLEARDK